MLFEEQQKQFAEQNNLRRAAVEVAVASAKRSNDVASLATVDGSKRVCVLF